MSDINKTLEQLQYEIRDLTCGLRDYKKLHEQQAIKINNLHNEIRDKDSDIRELVNQKIALQARSPDPVNNVELWNCRSDNLNLRHENKKFKEDYNALESKYDHLVAEKKDLLERNNYLFNQLEQEIALRSSFHGKNIYLQESQDALLKQRDEESRQKNDFHRRNLELNLEITHLKAQWKGQCTLVETLNEKIDTLTKQNTGYKSMVESVINRPLVMISDGYSCITREEYENKIRELEIKITKLTTSRDDLRKNNKALTTKIADLSKILEKQTYKIIVSMYLTKTGEKLIRLKVACFCCACGRKR